MNSRTRWSRCPVPIEALQPGDLVLAVPDGDPLGTPQFMPITAVYHNQSTELLTLTFRDGSSISLTAAHEVFTAAGGWGLAEDVRPGDVMLDKQGDLRVVDRIERAYAPVRTYNLTVAGSHAFFADGVWVHNCAADDLFRQFRGAFSQASGFIQGKLGSMTYRSEYAIKGTTLELTNLHVAGKVGSPEYQAALELVKAEARAMGMTELRIFAVRSTGASPGTIIERVINLVD